MTDDDIRGASRDQPRGGSSRSRGTVQCGTAPAEPVVPAAREAGGQWARALI